MTDDLVKQSLLELHDIVRCRCHPAYTGRGMHDPDCQCDSVEAVKMVADRIEELEAQLAKAVASLRDIEGRSRPINPTGNPKWINDHARATLAELKGDKDD